MPGLIDLARRKSEPKIALDYLREHSFLITLWPEAWQSAASVHALNWERVEFGRATIAAVPEQRGVYAFCVSMRGTIMPPHGVIVYFGETSRTLRQRYREYIRDSEKGSKRPRFSDLFNLWSENLDFYYAPIGDLTYDLKIIEEALNDAVIPHCVTHDFSAEVRQIVPILRG